MWARVIRCGCEGGIKTSYSELVTPSCQSGFYSCSISLSAWMQLIWSWYKFSNSILEILPGTLWNETASLLKWKPNFSTLFQSELIGVLFWIKVSSSSTPALCVERRSKKMKDVFMHCISSDISHGRFCKHTQAWPYTLILMSGATEVRALLTLTGGLVVMCLIPMRWTLFLEKLQ